MRLETSITTVSWLPSDLLGGPGRVTTRLGVTRHDDPPPEELGEDPGAAATALCRRGGCRFVNHLRVAAEVVSDVVGHGEQGGFGAMAHSTLKVAGAGIDIPAAALPVLRSGPEVGDGWLRFRQTVGGRTHLPIPRPLKHPPFVRILAPIVWTTLQVTIHSDGQVEHDLVGASAFPRHWVYDDHGRLTAKSGLADYRSWASTSAGRQTPWGDTDDPVVLAQIESAVERSLSSTIMGGSLRRDLQRVRAGVALVEQGAPGADVFLVLDGMLTVEVDGTVVAEVGPGAVIGERAPLEDGRRSATVRAATDCRLARVRADELDDDDLRRLAAGHHREDDAP